MLPAAVYSQETAVGAKLNFVVAGNARSGAAVIQSSLDNALEAVCHADLFHTSRNVRRQCHERYFGAVGDSAPPEWYEPGVTNPYQYLTHRIFDTALNQESAVGLRLLYPVIQKLELYDLFNEQYLAGDFCVVHVVRNPVACFVSLQQARRSKVWANSPNDPPQKVTPAPVTIDPAELIPFVRNHYATMAKIDRSCGDVLTVPYQMLFRDQKATLRQVYEFLELPAETPAATNRRRLRNRSMRERIANFASLRTAVPSDVLAVLDADDLF